MDRFESAKATKRSAGLAAAVAISVSALIAGAPASLADPYDDDGGNSSYSSEDGSGAGSETDADGGELGTGAGSETDADGGELGTEAGAEKDAEGGESGTEAGAEKDAGSGGSDGNAVKPKKAEASPKDVAKAKTSKVAKAEPAKATPEQVGSYKSAVKSSAKSPSTGTANRSGTKLSSPVTAWNSSWISYDRFYRPVFTNPYSTPLQVVYDYDGATRIFTVPPMQRAVIEVPKPGVYSFTGIALPNSGPPTTVAVGSFSGGGFKPAPGQAPPQKPSTPKPTTNALIQVSFQEGKSEPFRVKSLVELGKDPARNGAERVLLDGEIPAWCQWGKSPNGERMFQITETQSTPGLEQPGQEPLPGYEIQLAAADSSGSWFEKNKALVLGAGAGVLALIAGVTVLIRRRGAAAVDQ